jgi:hypothetical protein
MIILDTTTLITPCGAFELKPTFDYASNETHQILNLIINNFP